MAEGTPHPGTATQTLAVAPGMAGDTGWYRCVVRGRCGVTVSRDITLSGESAPALLLLAPVAGPVDGRPGLSLSWDDSGVDLEQASLPVGPWTLIVGATPPYVPSLTGGSGFFRLRVP